MSFLVIVLAALFFSFPLGAAIAVQDATGEKNIQGPGKAFSEWNPESNHFPFFAFPVENAPGGVRLYASLAKPTPWVVRDRTGSPPPTGGSLLPLAGEERPGKYALSLFDKDIGTLLHERREEAAGPDWKGITRDTGFYLLYQPVILGVFYLLPEDVIGYTRDQKKISANKWWRHVIDPRFDRDSFWLNFIAHPYWGSTFYTRARERGFDRVGSFGYAVLLSTMFEFVTESWYEPVSYNDLIVTPVLGSLIGAFAIEPLRDYVKSKPALKWYDHAALILTDPLGAANSLMERLLGLDSTIRVYYRPGPDTRSAQRCSDPEGRCLPAPRVGVEYFALW